MTGANRVAVTLVRDRAVLTRSRYAAPIEWSLESADVDASADGRASVPGKLCPFACAGPPDESSRQIVES